MRADLPRLFRFAEADAAFDGAQLLPSFEATLAGLGIDPATQRNVHLDVESRPGKSPRAFCVAVRVPQDVRLVVPPIGGRDDFTALLHEGGHVEHFAHVDPSLAFEYRHLGDNAITEAFAFLFDHLVEDPEWLRARLGVQDADGTLAAHARATRLIYLRRYAAKLPYELDVHAVDPPGDAALRERYATLLGAAARVRWPRETYLADLDPGFYVACYLRAWALETHLRAHLRERFGERWFERREAGDALRALWRDGQRLSAEELLGELTGAELDFGALLADLGLEGVPTGGAGRPEPYFLRAALFLAAAPTALRARSALFMRRSTESARRALAAVPSSFFDRCSSCSMPLPSSSSRFVSTSSFCSRPLRTSSPTRSFASPLAT